MLLRRMKGSSAAPSCPSSPGSPPGQPPHTDKATTQINEHFTTMASPTTTQSFLDMLGYKDTTTHLSVEEYAEQRRLLYIATDLRDYVWVWTFLGIPANIIIVVTILCMKVFSPATFFVTALAVSDGVALLSKFIGFQLANYEVNNTALCKMHMIVPYFSVLANWMQVAICFERCISVCYPLKKAYLMTKHRCIVAASVFAGVLFIIYSIPTAIIFTFSGFRRECVYDMTVITNEYAPYFQHTWFWMHACLYQILPSLIITGLTVAIIRSLVFARKHRTSLLRKGSGKQSDADQRLLQRTEMVEKTITIMLIVSSMLFVVFTVPANVYFLWYDEDDHKHTSYGHAAIFRQVATMLADATHVFNFFLYFLSAKRFRVSAINLFCKKCLPGRSVNPSGNKPRTASDSSNTKSTMLSNSNRVDTKV